MTSPLRPGRFDLERWTQTNIASGFVRKMRRESVDEFKRLEQRSALLRLSSRDLDRQQFDSKAIPTGTVEVVSYLLQKTQVEEREAQSLTQQFSKRLTPSSPGAAEGTRRLEERASELQGMLANHEGLSKAAMDRVQTPPPICACLARRRAWAVCPGVPHAAMGEARLRSLRRCSSAR